MATYRFSIRQRATILVCLPVVLLIAVPVALTSHELSQWSAFWAVTGAGTALVLTLFVTAGLNFTTVTSAGVSTGKRHLRPRFHPWPDIVAITRTRGSYQGTVISGTVEITLRNGRKVSLAAPYHSGLMPDRDFDARYREILASWEQHGPGAGADRPA